jgi:hypothetical protein
MHLQKKLLKMLRDRETEILSDIEYHQERSQLLDSDLTQTRDAIQDLEEAISKRII